MVSQMSDHALGTMLMPIHWDVSATVSNFVVENMQSMISAG